MDLLKEERRLWRRGKKIVIGLDEAGRGPLAGPVVAAAVLLKYRSKDKLLREILSEIKDSKKLSQKKREIIFRKIYFSKSIVFSWSRVSRDIIDRINILEATKLAMIRALKGLERKIGDKADFLLIDGNFRINISRVQKSIIKGDEIVFSIMAASIIAKVKRDRMMVRYHRLFPQYGFEKHKGYPTKYHRKMIKKYGPSKIHRITFNGVK